MVNTLFAAAEQGDAEATRLLLEQGAEVDARGRQQNTPLMIAALHGHTSVVRLLLQYGANPNAHSTSGHNALVMAGAFGHQSVVGLLIAAGATVGLLEAAVLGDRATLKRLLDAGTNVNEANAERTTPLIEAAHYGHTECVRLLLDRGADIDAQTGFGWTALMKALAEAHQEVALLLIERGADVRIRDNRGGTALMRVIMTYKMSRFAQPPNSDLLAHLHTAQQEMHDLIRLLVQHGADVNIKNSDGMTALWWAEKMHYRDICHLLRELGAYD